MFLQNRSLVELLSTALLRAHMGGSQCGGAVANVGVATEEEVAGDHREEGGDVMLLELAYAAPGIDTHWKNKRKPSIGMTLTIQRFLMLMLEEAGGSKRKCWTCPAVARIRSPAGAPGIPCLYHFYLKTAKSRNLRIKVTLGHLLLFLFREQTVFSVVNILRQAEPLKSRHGKGVRHVTEKSSLWNFLPMSDVDTLVVVQRLNYL